MNLSRRRLRSGPTIKHHAHHHNAHDDSTRQRRIVSLLGTYTCHEIFSMSRQAGMRKGVLCSSVGMGGGEEGDRSCWSLAQGLPHHRGSSAANTRVYSQRAWDNSFSQSVHSQRDLRERKLLRRD